MFNRRRVIDPKLLRDVIKKAIADTRPRKYFISANLRELAHRRLDRVSNSLEWSNHPAELVALANRIAKGDYGDKLQQNFIKGVISAKLFRQKYVSKLEEQYTDEQCGKDGNGNTYINTQVTSMLWRDKAPGATDYAVKTLIHRLNESLNKEFSEVRHDSDNRFTY